MVIYFVIAAVVLILAVIAFIASRPKSFHVERSAKINAPAEVAFSLVNDLHQWSRWSPFEKLDPNMKKTFDGPAAGPGAISGWSGNNKAGEGRMTILESRPNELIAIKLEFFRPFKATNRATFLFDPSDGGTRVMWAMDGNLNFGMKVFHLFMNMDKLLGKDFEGGLANLNSVAQTEMSNRSKASSA